MMPLLPALTLAIITGKGTELDCRTQSLPELLTGEMVTAIYCDGRPGFFVPSSRFRELFNAERENPFLKKEVDILEGVKTHLEGANKGLAKTASAAQDRADSVEKSLNEAEDDLREANKDVRELAKGGQWSTLEVVIWTGIVVAGVIGITYAVNQPRN